METSLPLSPGASAPESHSRCPYSGAEPAFAQARACPLSPPPAYADWRQEGALKRVKLWDGSTAWVATRYEDVRALLADPRVSADARKPGFPGQSATVATMRQRYPTFIVMDPPEHTVNRRMITGEFTLKRIEAMRPQVQAMADRLIDQLLDKGPPTDFVEDFAFPLTSLVICNLLGVPYEDHGFFQSKANILASANSTPEQVATASRELCDEYIASLIRRKDASPQDDLLSRLVVQQMRPGHISFEGLVALGRLLLIAGHETSANTLSVGLLTLLRHPEQLAALYRDPDLVRSAVEEILRYVDVTHNGRRRIATQDIAYGDQVIRAGEGIIAHNPSANRDPDMFEDPDRFDVHRDARAHVAFGYGVHQCLGQPLARLELTTALSTLLRRMPGLQLATAFDTLRFKDDLLVYGVHHLPLTWQTAR